MSKNFKLDSIRTLQSKGFSADELRDDLCYFEPEFKPFYERLPQGASKAQIIKQLVEYADQKLKIESLLAWAKQHNPTRYEKHQPYYDPSNGDTTYPKMMRRLMIEQTTGVELDD